jgi:hypothetical protein
MTTSQKVTFTIMVLLIIGILGAAGRYLSLEITGLLQTKDDALLSNNLYLAGFFGHVMFGMLAFYSRTTKGRKRF